MGLFIVMIQVMRGTVHVKPDWIRTGCVMDILTVHKVKMN